jgi:hypothetical protein
LQSIETQDFLHPLIGEEITSIGGHYVFTHERRMRCGGYDLFYLTGYAVLDSSCCGVGGTAFAFVPGIVADWKYRRREDGRSLSRLRPVADEALQRDIRRLIKQRESILQVDFG